MNNKEKKAYLIGGGIASLAAAVYLIKEGGLSGENINIFEELDVVGGSLDAKGSIEEGYRTRGGRMFTEEVWNATFELMSIIPSIDDNKKTLLDDFKDFNNEVHVHAKARLIQEGKIVDSNNLGLSKLDIFVLIKMIVIPESMLKDSKIADHFSAEFFETNFWYEWCTMFSFQPWHSAVEFKRYLLRFIQEIPGIQTASGMKHTRYNQYDSLIAPIKKWLKEKGVNIYTNTMVVDLEFVKEKKTERVHKIITTKNNKTEEIILDDGALVLFTNGCMTSNSDTGGMDTVPKTNKSAPTDSWALWEKISKNRSSFGRPGVFKSDIDKTKWISFIGVLKDSFFIKKMTEFTKNLPGTGGITTLNKSNWLITFAIPHQPYFINQPNEVGIFGAYALFPDKIGNFIKKKMSECTGREIMTEFCLHLGFTHDEINTVLEKSECIPTMMPYITSQFMPRKKGDRPAVIPKGTKNFAFIGQFCEIPDDIVFTIEYSVRTAIIATKKLLNTKNKIPPIYKGQLNASVLKNIMKTLVGV